MKAARSAARLARHPWTAKVIGALMLGFALGSLGALVPPTLSPANGVFSNLLVITLSAPPTGGSNLVSFNAGATWAMAGTNLTLDGYGTGNATIQAKTQSGATQSTVSSYGPYQFVVAATGVSPTWQPDHSSVAITLTNATTNAAVAWQNAGSGISSNNTFSANSPRTVTLYGFKTGYASSTNAWVLPQTPPPTISPASLVLSLTNLTALISVTPPIAGSAVSIREDAVVCSPPTAEGSSSATWWNLSAFDPHYWQTNAGPWQPYIEPIAAYTGPAAASTFGNGPCAIYANLLLQATAAATNELVSAVTTGFYPLAPAAPVISPNGGTFTGPVGATLSFPLAEQFGYSPDNGTNWVLSYYSGVSIDEPVSADLDWFNRAGSYVEGPQGYPVKDYPHFPGSVVYYTTADGVPIWSLNLGPGAIDSAAYAGWDGSTRLDLPFLQPPDATNQVSVIASGFNAFWQTNTPLAANGYGSEATGGDGPWPIANAVQSAAFSFQLSALAVTTNWAADHSILGINVVQAPANANLYYTLDGSAPSSASPLLAPGSLTNWTTTQMLLAAPGTLRLALLGYDTNDLAATYNGVSYRIADRGVNFRGYTPQTWSSRWSGAAPVTFSPPPARYLAPTSTALSCATPGSTIFLQVTPDPGNDTNLVGVSGSPMAVNGTYYWGGGQYTNELNPAIALGHVGTNTSLWCISWPGFGVLYTSPNLYGSTWTTTTNGVNPPPVTTATVGWHRYSTPVAITTNTLIQAYAYTAATFASATTNAAFTFGNPNPLPVGFQFVNGSTLRFSWSTNAGTVHVLFATNLGGPWTNVYTGTGVLSGTNDIRDFTITPPRGFYRFSN